MSEWGGRKAQQLTALCLATYGDICHLCDRPGADTADHLIARKRGGDDSIDNLRPAHQSCNSVRGDRSVSWARAYIARLRSAPLVAILVPSEEGTPPCLSRSPSIVHRVFRRICG